MDNRQRWQGMSRTQVILVRHGETTANFEQRWYGSLDAPLTERGWQQIEATGVRFGASQRERPVDVLYVSPLQRARSTAATIGRTIGLPPIVEEGLREFTIGDWEGRTYRELIDTEQLWERWANDPDFAPPNGESPTSFARRAAAVIQELAERHPGQRVLIVAHGAIISSVLDRWGAGGKGDWTRLDPHNCAVSELTWDGQSWRVELFNDISHLPPEATAAVLPSYDPEAETARP